MFTQVAALLALASTATAHFHLLAPEARGDSFEPPASQWIYPCANVNSTNSNRTVWPLDKPGAIAYNSSHEWALAYFNLGFGTGAVSFNLSLTNEEILNATAGVLCLPDLHYPEGLNITEGQNASVQVITISHSGAALYNCADITFSADAPAVDEGVCQNTTGIEVAVVSSLEGGENGTNSTEGGDTSAASGGVYSSIVSTVVVGLAAVGMSYFL